MSERNVFNLEPGDKMRLDSGILEFLYYKKERLPTLGKVYVATFKREDGTLSKFTHSWPLIEVEPGLFERKPEQKTEVELRRYRMDKLEELIQDVHGKINQAELDPHDAHVREIRDTFNKVEKQLTQSKARIRELEDRLVRIYEQIEHVYGSSKEQILAQLDNVKGDICVTLGKALSAKFNQSDKEK